MKQIWGGDKQVNCFPSAPEGPARLEMAVLLGFCEKIVIVPSAFWFSCGTYIAEANGGLAVEDLAEKQLWTTLPVPGKPPYQGVFEDGTPFSTFFGGHYNRLQSDFLAAEREREKSLLSRARAEHVNPNPGEKRFQDLYALCELFQITIHQYDVWGSCSVALVDIHPDWNRGTHGKYKHLIQFDNHFAADFPIGDLLGVPCTKRFDDYAIDI